MRSHYQKWKEWIGLGKKGKPPERVKFTRSGNFDLELVSGHSLMYARVRERVNDSVVQPLLSLESVEHRIAVLRAIT
jgi:hypothetical protein